MRLPRKREQVLRTISSRIEAGIYSTGERIPTEPMLAKEFGVARETLRGALEILEKRGAQGEQCGMSADFMKLIFEAIHEESVRQQVEIINK